MELVFNVVVPVVVTGLFNVILFRLQMKKEEGRDKADIITKLDSTIVNMLDRNTEMMELLEMERKKYRTMRDGALMLVKQVEKLEAEPAWKPNGS